MGGGTKTCSSLKGCSGHFEVQFCGKVEKRLARPGRAFHPSPMENHNLGLGGADSHPGCFTHSYNKDHDLKTQTEPHHLQKSGDKILKTEMF